MLRITNLTVISDNFSKLWKKVSLKIYLDLFQNNPKNLNIRKTKTKFSVLMLIFILTERVGKCFILFLLIFTIRVHNETLRHFLTNFYRKFFIRFFILFGRRRVVRREFGNLNLAVGTLEITITHAAIKLY